MILFPTIDLKDGKCVPEEHGIVGRALYDGRVTVPDAIRVLRGE
jgi:phosphoribosylformimino-5-aminoimidazole carboxamide ribonucleotide (ProFAR) isomerase